MELSPLSNNRRPGFLPGSRVGDVQTKYCIYVENMIRRGFSLEAMVEFTMQTWHIAVGGSDVEIIQQLSN